MTLTLFLEIFEVEIPTKGTMEVFIYRIADGLGYENNFGEVVFYFILISFTNLLIIERIMLLKRVTTKWYLFRYWKSNYNRKKQSSF